jgi:transcriptional regulator with XRE-family HTH domain
MKFNEKIVRLRKIKGITQDEFASAVGVSRQAVYKWESGQSYPEVAKLLEIKLLFNISIDDLLDDNFDIAMPEKKKKKRLPKAEVKKIEAEDKREIEAPAPAMEPVVVVEQTVNTPATENATVDVAPVVEKNTEAAPVEETTPATEEAQSEAAEEKKRGFFGRLFGRK